MPNPPRKKRSPEDLPSLADTTVEVEEARRDAHRATMPEAPKPLPIVGSPAWKVWATARKAWVQKMEVLEFRVHVLKQGNWKELAPGETPWRLERMCSRRGIR